MYSRNFCIWFIPFHSPVKRPEVRLISYDLVTGINLDQLGKPWGTPKVGYDWMGSCISNRINKNIWMNAVHLWRDPNCALVNGLSTWLILVLFVFFQKSIYKTLLKEVDACFLRRFARIRWYVRRYLLNLWRLFIGSIRWTRGVWSSNYAIYWICGVLVLAPSLYSDNEAAVLYSKDNEDAQCIQLVLYNTRLPIWLMIQTRCGSIPVSSQVGISF